MKMSERSLNDLLATVSSPVELLRNSQTGPNAYPGVPAEFTNWRDEQLAWQNTCVLFDQSFHMAELAVEGPGAIELLSHLGVNSFDGFTGRPGEAVCAVHARRLRDRRRDPVRPRRRSLQPRRPQPGPELGHVSRRDGGIRRGRRARSANRAALGWTSQVVPLPGSGAERDDRDRARARPGPTGASVLPDDDGGDRRQAGAGRSATGWSASRAGSSMGRGTTGRRCSRRCSPPARASALRVLEGGRTRRTPWSRAGSPHRFPRCTPDRRSRHIASGSRRRATRARRRSEGASTPRGSRTTTSRPGISATGISSSSTTTSSAARRSSRSRTPTIVTRSPSHSTTRTWPIRSRRCWEKSGRAKFIDWPSAVYSMHPFDKVIVDDDVVGVSTWIGYSANEGKMLTLAVIDAAYAEPGTEVDVRLGRAERRLGEADGRTARAGGAAGDRQPGPLRRGGPEGVRAGRLARRDRVRWRRLRRSPRRAERDRVSGRRPSRRSSSSAHGCSSE